MTIKTTYPKPERADMYDVTYDCANCGWSDAKAFHKGQAAPRKAMCARCGCFTAEKSVASPYAPRRLDEREYPPSPIDVPQPWWPKRPLCDITAKGERRWPMPYYIVG